MKQLIALTALLLTFASAAAQDYRAHTGDYFSLEAPRIMDKVSARNTLQVVSTKSPPDLLLSSADSKAVLSVSKKDVMFQDGELEMMAAFYKSGVSALFDRVEVHREEIVTEDGRDYFYLTFTGYAVPEEGAPLAYVNYVKGTLHNRQQVLFLFYVHLGRQGKFEPMAQQTLSTARFIPAQ